MTATIAPTTPSTLRTNPLCVIIGARSEQRTNYAEQLPVDRKPVEAVQFRCLHPAQFVVVGAGAGRVRDEPGQPQPQLDAVLDRGAQLALRLDTDPELLAAFAVQGRVRRLVG